MVLTTHVNSSTQLTTSELTMENSTATTTATTITESGAFSAATATHFIRKRRTRDLIDCMDVANPVGTGTYGVVYKAIDKTEASRPAVALKKIKMERETQGFPVTAIREIKILNLMNHENIVKLREIITYDREGDEREKNEFKAKGIHPGDVFMVFEYIEYDLDGLLKSPNFYPSSEIVKSYMQQLLKGVLYLHEKKILHRDIKSANLLISKNNVLKIADWGLARTLPPPNHKLTVPVVTLWYRSPELVFGTKMYGTEVDMWSVGCIFAELKQKSELFRAGTEGEIIDLIFRLLGTPQGALLDQYKTYPDWEKLNYTRTHPNRLTSEFGRMFDTFGLSLLERLLDLNPATRITAKDALDHRYFSPETVIAPSSLPIIDLAPVTGWAQQEKARKEREERRQAEHEERQQQMLKAKEEEMARIHAPPRPPPPPPAVQGTARPKAARDRDRENNPKLGMFTIKKPSAATTSSSQAPPPPPPGVPPASMKEEDGNAAKRQKVEHSSHNPPPLPPAPTLTIPPPLPPGAPPSHHHHSSSSSHHHQQPPPPPRSPRRDSAPPPPRSPRRDSSSSSAPPPLPYPYPPNRNNSTNSHHHHNSHHGGSGGGHHHSHSSSHRDGNYRR